MVSNSQTSQKTTTTTSKTKTVKCGGKPSRKSPATPPNHNSQHTQLMILIKDFTQYGTTLNNKTSQVSSNLNNNLNTQQNITPDMIDEEFQKLDISKAPGPDGINNKILKRAKYALKEIVAHLFNICLTDSFVPTQWKEANIIPIPKIKEPKEAGDYRPTALTSSLCKTFERIIVIHGIHLKYTETILTGRNTMDALIQVIEDWNRATDEGRTTHAVFFDFKKRST